MIGNQIFSIIANQREFSLKIFYSRRLLRTLPNYLFVLALYFLIPGFKEFPVLPPLWKFLTFTQNIDLKVGTAFSHAWSLCIEEQFYLIFPLMALYIANIKNMRAGWLLIGGILLGGIILRSFFWLHYLQHAGDNFDKEYYSFIYYFSLCRLDELVLGVAIAMLRNFHQQKWAKIIKNGNIILLIAIALTFITYYLFLHYCFTFWMTVIGYPLLALSFAALTLAALCPNSYLYRMHIPGAAKLAIWSYAIYLIHKPLIVLVYSVLAKYKIDSSSLLAIIVLTSTTLIAGWLLYTCIENPFLKLRDKLYKFYKISKISKTVLGAT